MRIDHLAIACADLDAGTGWAEDILGARFEPGGRHAHYATHNRLLSLGPEEYLEVIAPDPEAPPPGRPRWFGLDAAGPPRLANWIVACDDLEARPHAGEIVPLSRGALRWEITVPADGSLCEGGAHPSLIRWAPGAHPAPRLADRGLRLRALEVSHPEPARIAGLLADLHDDRVRFVQGPARLSAILATPRGPRRIG